MVLAQVPAPNRSFTFTENVALIVITAVIIGLAVPLVKGYMDRRRDERQRAFQADLERDSKVIERQYELLKELSKEAWAIVGLIMPVTYYKVTEEPAKFETAWARYEAEWFPTMLRFRALVSQARRLVSPAVHHELVTVFDYWFGTADPAVRARILAGDHAKSWWAGRHNAHLQFAFSETERVLGLVAQDIGIMRSELPGDASAEGDAQGGSHRGRADGSAA